MPLVFRDYQVLVVSPGSQTTQVQSGIPESLLPAAFELPTKVYKGDNGQFTTSGEESLAVYPIQKGALGDIPAFLYFLKVVYRSAATKDAPPPALALITSISWNRRQIEHITRYAFEEIGVPALAVISQGITVAYAYATADALVIDVGYEKTEVSFITEFDLDKQASRIVAAGGHSITESLQKLLPDLSLDQSEDLKLSHIAEVLSQEDKARAPGDAPEGVIGEEEEGVVDVAAIVSSGRTREILEERERRKKGADGEDSGDALNKDLEVNTFTDRNGETITVGRERFEGTAHLIRTIVDAIGEGVQRLKPRAQQQVWDNVCITGKGAALHGFRSALVDELENRFLISRPAAFDATSVNSGAASAVNSSTPAPVDQSSVGGYSRQTPDENDLPVQAPSSIRLSKISDHFPEWKEEGWETAGFLGAQIAAKQIFTAGLDGVFVSRQDYNELGPSAIWDV